MLYQSMMIDIKTKIRTYGDSLFVYENKYYLQAYLGNCAYKIVDKEMIVGFSPSTFVYSRFFPKIRFLYCLPSSLSP